MDSPKGVKRNVNVYPLSLFRVERVAPGLAVPSRGVVAASQRGMVKALSERCVAEFSQSQIEGRTSLVKLGQFQIPRDRHWTPVPRVLSLKYDRKHYLFFKHAYCIMTLTVPIVVALPNTNSRTLTFSKI